MPSASEDFLLFNLLSEELLFWAALPLLSRLETLGEKGCGLRGVLLLSLLNDELLCLVPFSEDV